MMLSSSLPTLNAITARTFTEMPCLVTQVSATSASCMDRVRYRALRKKGMTKVPWPTTTRNGAPPRRNLPPEIIIAASGAGTRYPNMVTLLRRHQSGNGSSGSTHGLTSTVRVPRLLITRTVEPRGRGSGDHAMKASDPPRILTRTSPGPPAPRVAMMRTPMEPIRDSSPATTSRSSQYPTADNTHYRLPTHRWSGPGPRESDGPVLVVGRGAGAGGA